MFEMVKLPPGEKTNEWLAVHCIDFYNKINMLFSEVVHECTEESCASMSAGPNYQYLWRDGKTHKKPIEISAKLYISKTLDWCEEVLNDESIFPQTGNAFPKSFRSVVKDMMKRVFRAFAHCYFSHFAQIQRAELESQVQIWIKQYIAFVIEFELVKERELEPMKKWIESHLNIDLHKTIKQKKKEAMDGSSNSDTHEPRRRRKSKFSAHAPTPSLLNVSHEPGQGANAARKSVMGNIFIDSHKMYESDYHVSSLIVEVIEAKNLTGKDFSGSSDPYCQVEFEGSSQKTDVQWKQLNPKWNAKYSFIVNDTNSKITFSVFDENRLLKGTLIGKLEVELNSLLDEEEHDLWFALKAKESSTKGNQTGGALHVKLKFTSSENGAAKYLGTITNLLFYKKLKQFLLAQEEHILMGLFDISKVSVGENIWKSMLYVISYGQGVENREKVISTLKYLVSKEVEQCNRIQSLFRSNSIASKMLAAYFKMEGHAYLKRTLRGIVTNICTDDRKLEVNPANIPDKDAEEATGVAEKNMEIVLDYAQQVFDAIIGSLDSFPITLREVIRHLSEKAEKRFTEEDNAGFLAVGGLLFLRFISPALISPTVNQLYVGTLSSSAQRSLTLISKMLQQLANDINFGIKETFMEPANVFLEKNRGMSQGQIHKFFHDLTSDELENSPQSPMSEGDLTKRRKLAEERLLWGLHNIHKHFHANTDKMRVLFMQFETMEPKELARQSYIPITDKTTLVDCFMKLGDMMDNMGPPPKLSLQHRARVSKSRNDATTTMSMPAIEIDTTTETTTPSS